MVQLSSEFDEWSEDEGADWLDESADLAEALRESLVAEYADATASEMSGALANVLESMSPAEAFNFAKALKQIPRGAGRVLADPTFGQIAGSALPIAGGALGTVIGGPVGTALGTSLGTAAAKALPRSPTKAPVSRPAVPPPVPATATPAVAGGSAAAAQGLVLTQEPDVLKSLLALAMGKHGQKTVSGVPVASIMSMLSSVFGQAAADADELMYLDQEAFGEPVGEDISPFVASSTPDRSIYTTLMDVDNDELAEALESL
jgi:hypothetical protein